MRWCFIFYILLWFIDVNNQSVDVGAATCHCCTTEDDSVAVHFCRCVPGVLQQLLHNFHARRRWQERLNSCCTLLNASDAVNCLWCLCVICIQCCDLCHLCGHAGIVTPAVKENSTGRLVLVSWVCFMLSCASFCCVSFLHLIHCVSKICINFETV